MKKRLLREAAINYCSEYGSATATDICYNGKTDSGRRLKDYKAVGVHPQQAYAWLRIDPAFVRIGKEFKLKKVRNDV
tara:strand:+ start:564 stop:794 length:231 start_codon:yes stop_codon:yes gene_type:complete